MKNLNADAKVDDEYILTIQLVDIDKPIITYWKEPPVRDVVATRFYALWHRLSLKEQDTTWVWILIVDFVPLVPFIGKIDTFYGSIECAKLFPEEDDHVPYAKK